MTLSGGEPISSGNPGGMPLAPVENIPAIPGTKSVSQPVNPSVDPDIAKLQSTVDAAAAKVAEVPAIASTESPAGTPLTTQEKFKEFNDRFADKPVVNIPEGSIPPAPLDTVPLDPNIVENAKILAEAPVVDSTPVTENVQPSEQVAKTPEESLQEEVKVAIKLGAEEQEKKINEAVDKFLKTIGENRAKTALS